MARKRSEDGLGIAPAVAMAVTQAPKVINDLEKTETGSRILKTTTDVADFATASAIYRYKRQQKALKIVGYTALGALVIFGGYKAYQAIRINNLKKKVFTNPEVKGADDMWNAIPDSFKTEWSLFSVLNPFSFISTAITKIKGLWEPSCTEKVYRVAKSFHDKKLDLHKVAKVFKTMYKIDWCDIIVKVLSNEEYKTFKNYLENGTASDTANSEGTKVNAETGKKEILYAVTKSQANVRESPSLHYNWNIFTNNTLATAPAHCIVGQWTDIIERDDDDDVNFAGLNAIVYKGGDFTADVGRKVYVAKSQIYPEGYTWAEIREKFGNISKAGYKDEKFQIFN